MTMLRIPAGSFVREGVDVMLSEFWLSDRQVSVEPFLRFAEEASLEGFDGYDQFVHTL